MNTTFFALPPVDVSAQAGGVGLDLISTLLGALVAGGIVYLVIRFRPRLMQVWTSLRERSQNSQAQARARSGFDARYREAVVKQANAWHLAGHLVPLSEIAVAPQFLPVPRPFDPNVISEDEIDGPFGLVPFVLDYPQAAGIYGLPGTDIYHVLRGADFVALLGPPGSGRSTALALMAILVAQQNGEHGTGEVLNEYRTPVLFHLGDVDLSTENLRGAVDPAELLASAVQMRMVGSGANVASGIVPPALAEGACLVLADGWDELPPRQRTRALEWLIGLMQTYPGNQLVVAAPARGYATLVESGLTPVALRPWGDHEYARLASRWATAWPNMATGRKDEADEPDATLVRNVALGNRARTPIDVTLKVWAAYAGDTADATRKGWYDAYVRRMLPIPEAREGLRRMAMEDLKEEERFLLGSPEVELSAYLDAALAKAGALSMDTPDLLHEITTDSPMLVERANQRYSFAHPLIGGFLAAETLASTGRLVELRGGNGTIGLAMSFVMAMSDVAQFIEDHLQREPEILQDNLLGMVSWAVDAPADAPWRNHLMERASELMLAQSQFPIVRERALAALVASRDRGTALVFKQGLRSDNALVRVLCLLGLGALADPDQVSAIVRGLSDDNLNVQAAAALALGVIRSEESLEHLVRLLFDGSEPVQRAVAEALANNRAQGHQLLREAATDDDVAVRRAAIFGLVRINEDWVRAILEERQMEDDQWIVRDAALGALEAMRFGTNVPVPPAYPLPERLEWLIEWGAERGESVPVGPQAVEFIVRALQEGDDTIRLAAADTLGKLGGPESIQPLYSALRDPSAHVREQVYRSLANLSLALDKSLPGVI